MTDTDTLLARFDAAKAALVEELSQTVIEQDALDGLWATYDQAVIACADRLNVAVFDTDYDDLLARTQDALIGHNHP